MAKDATGSGGHAARFWREDGGRLRCTLCPRGCRLGDGQTGFCGARRSAAGRLVSLVYGRPASVALDPIEKKPLYHFYPGSRILSLGTVGCNLACRFCQNASLSRARAVDVVATFLPPDDVAGIAVREGARSVAFTYNEPTIFAEYAIDVARACRAAGVATVMVTNGYVTPEAVAEIYPFIDGANVDLKSFSEEFYRRMTSAHLAPVLAALEAMRAAGTWLELTWLLIPGANDGDDEIARACDWVLGHLGDEVPMHFSAFHPDHLLTDRPATSREALARARRVAQGRGLKHVYCGNILDEEMHTTTCPGCGEALIRRTQFAVSESRLGPDGRCPCGRALAGRFDAAPGTAKHPGGRRLLLFP